MRHLLFIALLLLLTFCAEARAVSIQVLPPWTRLAATSVVGADYHDGICLSKGETGSVQMAVWGASPSYPVSWTSPAELAVTGYSEVWTYTAHDSIHWYPDGLRPLANGGALTLDGTKPGAVWLDVRASRTMAAGTYSVSVTVAGVTKAIPVTIYWFALPEKPALQSAIGTWPASSTKNGCRGKLAAELLLLDNRLMATFIDATHAATLATAGQTQAHVGGYASLSGSNVSTPKPSATTVDGWVAKYQPLRPYSYLQDEEYAASTLAALDAYSVNTVGRSRRMMTTTITSASAWLDITCVLYKFITDPLVSGRLAAGREVWGYQTLKQDSFTPHWLLDCNYAEHSLSSGFLSWRYKLTGLLYWRADYWKVGTDPWTSADGYGVTYPGEALWLLPLPDGTFAPTIRLKWMRDGVNTFDYLTLLKAAGQEEFADQITRMVASSWTNWSRDGAAIETARRLLGKKLDELARPKTVVRTDSYSIDATAYPDEPSAMAAGEAILRASGAPVTVTRSSRMVLQ